MTVKELKKIINDALNEFEKSNECIVYNLYTESTYDTLTDGQTATLHRDINIQAK